MDDSDVINFNGIRFLSVASAARELGYAPDYLTRLCREEKLSAKQVGRRWYVDPNAIQTFLSTQEERRVELSRKRRAELQHVSAMRAAATLGSVAPRRPEPIDRYADSTASAFLPKAAAAFFAIALMSGVALAGASVAGQHPGYGSNSALESANQLASAAEGAAGFLRTLAQWLDPLTANYSTVPHSPSQAIVPSTSLTSRAPATTTIVYQTINQPVVERIVQAPALATPEPLSDASFVTQDELQGNLSQLGDSLRQLIYQNESAPNSLPASGGYDNEIAASQNIDQLSGTTLNNVTVNGVSGLTASDIPTDIVAANYLPLAGGTVTGTTTFSGVTLGQNCSSFGNGGKLTTDALGNVICAADQSGGAGSTIAGSNTQVQFNSGGGFDASAAFTFASSTALLTVTNASTTNFIASNATSSDLFASLANLTSAVVNTLSGTTLTYAAASTTNVSASAEGYFATASTTNLTVSGAASGFLETNSQGVVTATSSIETSILTGMLGVANGGTGSTTLSGILLGNGASALNTATVGNGLSLSGTALNNTGVLSIGPAGQTLSGNVTLATSTNTTNGLTSALTILGSGSTQTLTPSLSGTLTAGGGGTGIANPSASGILVGSYAGGAWQQLATSSLDLLTTNVAEGSNLYFTNARAQDAISVSGSPLTYSSGIIGINQASASQSGYLAPSDWTTFNNKVASTSLSSGTGISYNPSTGVIENTGVTSISGTANQINASSATGAITLSLPSLVTLTNASTSILSAYGTAYFGGSATSSFNSGGQLTLANLANSVLSVNASGQVVATSSIGTNLVTGTLGSINGTSFSVGSSITVGSASTTLLSNNNAFSGNNSFTGNTTFTNATTSSFAITNLSNFLLAVNANGTVIATTSIGTNLLTGTLGVGNGGTGANSLTGILLGNGTSPVTGVTTSAGIAGAISDETGSGFLVFSGSPTFTGTAKFANASTSIFSAFGPAYFGSTATSSFNSAGQLTLAGLTNTLLSVNGSGQVVSTSTIGNNQLQNSSITVNSTNIALGGSVTITAASSTLLANNDTWTGLQTFANSSSTLTTLGTTWFSGLSNGILSTNANGQVVATTSIGTNYLTGNLATINGTTIGVGSTNTITAASSTLLSNNNTWTGLQSFADASGTLTTLGTTWFSGISNAILSANANGQVVATTSIGTNLLTGTLGISNGGTGLATTPSYGNILVGNGSGYTLTATSSLGLQSPILGTTGQVAYFSGTTSPVGTSSLSIASTGFVGIGTTTPVDELQIAGLANPIEASSTTSGLNHPRQLFVSGRYAYVASNGNSSLIIYDISNPAAPVKVGSTTSGLSAPYSVYVSGHYAYVTDTGNGTVLIFDISNPAAPVKIGTISSGLSDPTSVYVQGRYAYVTDHFNGFFIFDISNPAVPVEVGSDSTDVSEPGSVYVQGRYAYIADQNLGFVILDVSNPASPTLAGSSSTGLNLAMSIYVQDDYAYVISQNNNSLVVFNVSNPAAPVEVGSTASGLSNPTSVYVSGRYAYVASGGNASLVVFDISNHAAPVEVGSTTNALSSPTFVYSSGRYAYVASYGNNSLVSFQVGGEYAQSLEVGTLQASSLELDNNLQALDGAFSGGLTVGQSLDVTGSAGIVSASTTYNTTANIFNIATAYSTNSIFSVLGNGNVGLGTTTPGSALSINGVGNFVASATSTLYNGLNVTGGCVAVNGTCLGSGAGTSDVSTTSQNVWSALQIFSGNASSSNLSNFGAAYFGGTATSSFNSSGQLTLAALSSSVLSVNSSGQVVATTSIGTNLLTGALATVNGSAITAGGSASITAASSTLLANNNTFSGNNLFSASTTISNILNINQSSTSLATLGTLYLPNLANSLLSTNSSGQVIATTSINTGLLTGTLGVGNGGTGANTFSYGLLLSPGGTGALTNVATSSLGLAPAFTTSYPILYSGNNLSLGFGTTSANAWSSLQTFSGGASSTNISASGFGYFTTASTTNLSADSFTDNGVTANTLLYANGSKQEASATVGSSLSFSGGTLSLNTGSSDYFTALEDFSNASTSQLTATSSVYFTSITNGLLSTNAIGQVIATSTISSNLLSVPASSLLVGNSSGQLVATTSIGTNLLTANSISGVALGGTLASLSAGSGLSGSSYNGSGSQTFSLNLAHANSWTGLQSFQNASTSILSVYGPAYFGGTATSSFSSSGALSLVSNGLTVGTNQLVVSGGNVGVNTASPGAQFGVSAASGNGIASFTYGSVNTPLPIDPNYGYAGLVSTVYASSTATSTDPAAIAIDGTSHLSAGQRSLSIGILGQSYDDGSWVPGDAVGGNVGVWGNAFSSNGGAIYGANFNADSTDVAASSLISLELDMFDQVNGAANKYGLVIEDDNDSIGTVAGTITLATGATVPNDAALAIQTDGGPQTPYGWDQDILTVEDSGGMPPVRSSGTLWRAGGFSTAYGLNWSDMTFTTAAIETSNFIVTGSGNVGIGTTGPTSRLFIATSTVGTGSNLNMITLQDTGAGDNQLNRIALQPYTGANQASIDFIGSSLSNFDSSIAFETDNGTGAVEAMRVNNAGNVGIGTTTPYSRLTIWGPDTASTSAFAVVNSASTTEFTVYDTGNAVLAGSLTQNSDIRLKTNISELDGSSSLAEINELNPVTFNWIDPNKGMALQLGFIAQQVLPIFPNLISTTSPTALSPDGTLSLNYIGLISPIVSAIQALSSELSSIENTLAGFADSFTTNELTFNRATGQELCLQQSNGTPVCVTGDQLAAVLAEANASQSPGQESGPSSDSGATTTTDTPPVIQINGDNTAIAQVGDTYSDLGATITGPQDDLNLGITTYVNGIETSPVQIDTSAVATDTIDYVVTDQNGLTATTTRTVIIEASPSIIPTDNASTTDATSTTPA